jgi:hypothetical protein
MTRQMFVADSFDDMVAQTVKLAQMAGATNFELRHEPTDRVLGPGEEIRPDEPLRWSVIVTAFGLLGSDQKVGSAVSPRGSETNVRAILYACVRVVELLGANMVVVDPSDEEEPAW